jgi:DNA-binding CsgD family transcriptional regulator
MYLGAPATSGHIPVKVARATVAALDLVGVPGAILDAGRQVVAANRRLERLIPGVIRESTERLQLADVAADELLGDALARLPEKLSQEGRGDPAPAIPIPAARQWPPVIIRLFALDGMASEAIHDALTLLTATIVAPRDAPTIPIIQGLFDMTPAEARVAQAVAQCHTLDAIATQLGLSRQTLRSQIRGALGKAGCARNIDLAALLSGVGSTAG